MTLERKKVRNGKRNSDSKKKQQTRTQHRQTSLLAFWGGGRPSTPVRSGSTAENAVARTTKETGKKRKMRLEHGEDCASFSWPMSINSPEKVIPVTKTRIVSPTVNDKQMLRREGAVAVFHQAVPGVVGNGDDSENSSNADTTTQAQCTSLVALAAEPMNASLHQSAPSPEDAGEALVESVSVGATLTSEDVQMASTDGEATRQCSYVPEPTENRNKIQDGNNAEATKNRYEDHNDQPNDGSNRQLSDYELLRLRNIARNNARLMALGLLNERGLSASMGSPEAEARRSRQRKQRQRRKVSGDATVAQALLPTRRSARVRKSPLQSTAVGLEEGITESLSSADNLIADDAINDVVREAAEEFTVSPVVQYTMNAAQQLNDSVGDGPDSFASTMENCMEISSLSPVGTRLQPPNGLGAIYTLQIHQADPSRSTEGAKGQSWLVGAGKAGIVALWDCDWSRSSANDENADEIDPVLSWKAHDGRWVSDARFVPSGGSGSFSSSPPCSASPSRLVTAGNDGTVCLWDLTTTSVRSGAPKLLSRSGKELHTSGIFSMDIHSGSDPNSRTGEGVAGDTTICTGSKDKSVAVTSLVSIARGNDPIWRSYDHASKVGAVALRGCGTSLIASASDNGYIAVYDYRADGEKDCVVGEIQGAHTRPHSVVWNPERQDVLMTAGLDEIIKTWDMRNLAQPLQLFHGHVPKTGRLKKIHHPVFYIPPAYHLRGEPSILLTGGEGSHSLSMYKDDPSNNAGEKEPTCVFSRGKLPHECGDVGSIAVYGDKVAVAVDGGEVMLLAPSDE